MVSHLFLQHYWWFIVSLLAGLLVFLLFVQGGQSFVFSLPRTALQKTMIVNAMGRKWEFTFTTLVTFGGAFFASFPLFYATSFGGAYWVWIAILFCFVIQAVAYEYRSKPGNIYGQNTFDAFLFINGSLGPLLLGIAVATFFTGSNFTLNRMNQVRWDTSWYGLEAVLSVRNLSLGLAVLFLARVNGLLFIIKSIGDEDIISQSRKALIVNSVLFLVPFLYFVVSLLVSPGFAVDRSTGIVAVEEFKYLHNFLEMPLVLLLFLAGVIGVLYGIGATLLARARGGIWFSGTGTVLAVLALFLVAGYNGTSFYPSLSDLQSSLTIYNSSSSSFTLRNMMYVSFIIPLVLAYIWYAWKALTAKKITQDEMSSEDHVY
ncbi:MAG: cytochrome d ubiquinol oxidase subunit II [Bacteroidales bacterium]|nr:cytochrome d ubiquinol oxidase subunit II [Bacteroidales bacterium]